MPSNSDELPEGCAIVLGIFVILFVVVGIPFLLWLRFLGPCDWMDWMPLKDIPARCTTLSK